MSQTIRCILLEWTNCKILATAIEPKDTSTDGEFLPPNEDTLSGLVLNIPF